MSCTALCSASGCTNPAASIKKNPIRMATVAALIKVDRESANNVVRSTGLVILSILLIEAFHHNVILFDAMSNFPIINIHNSDCELGNYSH